MGILPRIVFGLIGVGIIVLGSYLIKDPFIFVSSKTIEKSSPTLVENIRKFNFIGYMVLIIGIVTLIGVLFGKRLKSNS